MNIIIATIKSWNIHNAQEFKNKYQKEHCVTIITEKNKLTLEVVQSINPDYMFFPHWSYIIPEEIFKNWTCVVFHMTDLPFGRGGSPLQNLIVRGFEETKISALKVIEELDAGPIYLKESLKLCGNAHDIFSRASNIIFNIMIPKILEYNLDPTNQVGQITVFKRRKPSEGKLIDEMNINTMYDYIRMLDGEGYPNAFITFGKYRIEFYEAQLEQGVLEASVRIKEDIDE